MTYTPIVLNNLREGLRSDVESFLLPEGASPDLLNITYFRGRLVEKGGEELFCRTLDAAYKGRLGARVFEGTTDASGEIPSATSFLSGAVSPNTVIITQGALIAIDDGQGNFEEYQDSGWAGTGTFNYATGATSSAITGWASSTAFDVYLLREVDQYSPAMGLVVRNIDEINVEELIAFDRLKPYRFSVALDRFQLLDSYESPTDAVVTFSGSNSDFFDYTNYKNALFVTNNVPGFDAKQDITAVSTGATTNFTFTSAHGLQVGDYVFAWDVGGVTFTENSGAVTVVVSPTEITVAIASSGVFTSGGTVQSITRKIGTGDGIKWYNPSGWHNYYPPYTGTNPPSGSAPAEYLMGALLLIPYKGFLVALNTWEGATYASRINRQQRARWCQNGTPFYSNPIPADQGVDPLSWIQSTGRGGFIDASTQEQIVSAELIRDTLVVFFEQSTWILDFTEDLFLPFVWRQVNKDYGSESTFSTVSFDKAVFSVAEDGFIATDGVNLERIDQKIPDTVYTISNQNDGQKRVHGQINFVGQTVKWCYPTTQNNSRIVFPNQELIYNFLDKSWSVNEGFHTCFVKYERFFNLTWADARYPWSSANFPWNNFDDEDGDTVTVGGNAQGFIHELPTEQITQQSYNDPQFRVTSVNASGQIIVPNHSFTTGQFVSLIEMGGSNAVYNNIIYKVQVISSTAIALIGSDNATQVLATQTTSSGFVSQVPNMIFFSKRFYAGNDVGLQCRLGYIDFLFNPSALSQTVSVDLYIDEFTTPAQTKTFDMKGADGSTQAKIVKRVYFNAQGTSFAFKLYYPESEMFDSALSDRQFVLHQFTPYVKATGRFVRQPTI